MSSSYTVVCQKKFVTVVKEGADVELSIKDICPITNHRAWPWALGAASVSEVDCNAMALPPLSRGSQQETIALDALVVVILRGVKEKNPSS